MSKGRLIENNYSKIISDLSINFLLFISMLFCALNTRAQNSNSVTTNTLKPVYKVWAEVVNGDTIPSIRLSDVWIYADYPYKSRKQREAWTRTKYNVKLVYPYAILASAKLKEYNTILEKMPNEKTRKAYMKVVEKELRAEFEEPLKDLSITQGRILLKLIDRETSHTSYELVKGFRGDFQAFMWQSVARLFGNNMKAKYDSTGEDIMIERAIRLIEAGQF
ncbi:MAG: DUF4294 domain-containing protein [Chitinophagaceae bacterium]|nr:DUF4294 domain-containing protein [Chitinophagaceae bacterium]